MDMIINYDNNKENNSDNGYDNTKHKCSDRSMGSETSCLLRKL